MTKRSATQAKAKARKKGTAGSRRRSAEAQFLEELEELRSKITAAGQVSERDQHLSALIDKARRCPDDPDTRTRAAAILLAARAGLRKGERRLALVFKAAQLDLASRHAVLAENPELVAAADDPEAARAVA